ncbi:MAG TPA: hypothetical protein ENN99_09050 [Chloroflexi bacterium]|nr:hypothetical protein [Chloroflexota bacterium]
MNTANFTVVQRRTIILMVVAVVVVFAVLSGFVITSLQGWEEMSPVTTPSSLIPTSTSYPTPSPIPSPVPTFEEGIWSQVQFARLFDQIAYQVESIRGLAPRAEVPLSFRNEREMAALLRQLYAGRDLEDELSSYVALGLLPDVPISIQPHQQVGIYVPEQGQLFVSTGRYGASTDDQALLAHAYIHALQDQQFGLGAMDDRASTTDAVLAVRAFVEGDASLVTAFYQYGDPAVADWEHLLTLIMQAEQPSYGQLLERVETWTQIQRFPYWEGRRFVQALFEAGGWEGVNRAYINPPRSTAQVLHPERYLEGTGNPGRVVVPDLGGVLGEGWRVLLQDTQGEFVIRLYLASLLPEDTAVRAAAGWSGDTCVIWEHRDGRRVFVWRTIWEDTEEAAEFETALVQLIPQQHLPAWPQNPPRGLGGWWWETPDGGVHVARLARHVVFVTAPDFEILTEVVERLP